jgi:hypothetical protein
LKYHERISRVSGFGHIPRRWWWSQIIVQGPRQSKWEGKRKRRGGFSG